MSDPKRGDNPFLDAAMLVLEAQQVVALWLVALAADGPAAEAEARQMIEEKFDAATRRPP